MSCPPTSQTVNEMFLYSTVSTLKPIVGIVVTTYEAEGIFFVARDRALAAMRRRRRREGRPPGGGGGATPPPPPREARGGRARARREKRRGGPRLAELELVEDGRLTGGVEADHQDAHLLLAEHALPDAGERETHGCDAP